MSARTGHCLCGAVSIRATLTSDGIHACHCTMCQRWTGGGPYLAVHVADLEVGGEDAILRYRGSAWGERANCAHCGSPLWWTVQGRAPRTIALGLLDDQSGLAIDEEIYVDRRPGWLPAVEGARQSTEADEDAKRRAYMERKA